MIRAWILAWPLALAIMAFASPAFGQEQDSPEARVASGIPAAVAARAGISPDQQREIGRLTREANEGLEPLRRRHRESQQRLQEMLKAASPDESEVLAQLERVAAAETAVRKNRVQLMLRIRKFLGPKLWNALQAELEAERRVAERRRQEGTLGEGVETETVGGSLRTPVPKD